MIWVRSGDLAVIRRRGVLIPVAVSVGAALRPQATGPGAACAPASRRTLHPLHVPVHSKPPPGAAAGDGQRVQTAAGNGHPGQPRVRIVRIRIWRRRPRARRHRRRARLGGGGGAPAAAEPGAHEGGARRRAGAGGANGGRARGVGVGRRGGGRRVRGGRGRGVLGALPPRALPGAAVVFAPTRPQLCHATSYS